MVRDNRTFRTWQCLALMHSRNVRATFFPSVCEFKHRGRALYTFTTMMAACCGRSESSRARPLEQVGLLDRQGFAVGYVSPWPSS